MVPLDGNSLRLDKPRIEDICCQEVYNTAKHPPNVQSQTRGKLWILDVIQYMKGGGRQENNSSAEMNHHMLSF